MNTLGMQTKGMSLQEKLDFYSMREPNTGCWLWLGASCRGYGHLKFGTKAISAHRASYELTKGAIQEGLTIDHRCRVTLCINPQHLEAVTHKINVLRGISLSALNARKTHCKNGHPLDGDNLYKEPLNDHRRCRICRQEKKARWKQRQRKAA